MNDFSWASTLGRGRAALRSRLTLRGPRAYANTHEVALSLLPSVKRTPSAAVPKALDLGAGRGELSTELVRLGFDVTAVERYAPQFEAEVPLVDADLNERFPFEDGSFDAVMAIEILESVLSRDLFAVSGQWDLLLDHPWRLRNPYAWRARADERGDRVRDGLPAGDRRQRILW
jgi:SAM-dependent methyltransferase